MAAPEMSRSKLGTQYPRAEVEAAHADNMKELRAIYGIEGDDSVEIDEDLAARLRALGYVDG